MPVVVSTPTPSVRALLEAFREARERAGMSSRDLSLKLGFSHAYISHWETGRRIPAVNEVVMAVCVLGVVGAERRRIIGLARAAAAATWLERIPSLPPQLAEALNHERPADAIDEWAPAMVPSIVQTSAYTRAVYTELGRSAAEVETRALVQAGRREILTRTSAPVVYTVLMSEVALRGPVGTPQVMAEQLDDLLALSSLGNVRVRVVSAFVGGPGHLAGQFCLYHFPDAGEAVRHDHLASSVVLTAHVGGYRAAMDTMADSALSVRESRQRIEEIARDWKTADGGGE